MFLKDKKILTKRVCALLLGLLVSLELFSYIHRERPRRFDSFAKVPYIEFLKSNPEKARAYGIFWAFYPNTATGFQVDDLGVFFSLVPKRFVYFVNNLLIENHFRNDLRPPALRMIPINEGSFLDLLNVRFLVTPATDSLRRMLTGFDETFGKASPLYEGEANIYLRGQALPRAFVVHRGIFVNDEEKTFQILKKIRDNFGKVCVINDTPDAGIALQLKGTDPESPSKVTIEEYSPNNVVIQTELKEPGILILSDSFHPDWKAFVNGKETKIFRTDYLIRSVFLPAGVHEVRFVFAPFSFYAGLGISFLAAGAIVLLIFGHRLASKRNGQSLALPIKQN